MALVRPHKFHIPTSIVGCSSPKNEFTCVSPKKRDASVRNGKQLLLDSRYVLLKRVGLAGDSHFHNWAHTFCQHFTEKPLFIFNKIPAIIMYIPPPFHFSSMIKYWLLSYLFFLPFLFWCLCQNYYKYLTIEVKKGVSEGEVHPAIPPFFKLNLFKWCIPGFCQHFTENPLFISNKILAIIMSIPPTFPLFF